MNWMQLCVKQYKSTKLYLNLCLGLTLSLFSFQLNAAEPASEEYKIKAALIYKITRFVEWPRQIPPKTTAYFGLCLLGRDDFGRAIDALQGNTIGQKPILIQRFNQSNSINQQCQLVFISDSKQAFLKPILRTAHQHPVLTIGDSPSFAEKGGMIQLSYHNKRIEFKINLNSVKKAGLKIYAPLLEMATIVGD